MITPSDVALQKITKQIEKRGKGLGIRIGIKTTGCSGLAYILEFVDIPTENDLEFPCGMYKIYVDRNSYEFVKGLTIDWEKNGLNEGFKFINPNEKDKCGCGSSFRV